MQNELSFPILKLHIDASQLFTLNLVWSRYMVHECHSSPDDHVKIEAGP